MEGDTVHKCPKCHHEFEVEVKGERKFVDVPEQWFTELCHTLSKMPDIDAKFSMALDTLPKDLRKWKKLTEGQWKFFGVIHNKLTGSWPSIPKVPTNHDIPFEPTAGKPADFW